MPVSKRLRRWPLWFSLIHCHCDSGPWCGAAETGSGPSTDLPRQEGRFVDWAKHRADREIVNVMEWALGKGLASPADEANEPPRSWGHDVGEECKPGLPMPRGNVCAGVHSDTAGWRALLVWKYGDPTVVYAEYVGYAKLPLSCLELKSQEVGRWESDASPGLWIGGICRGESYHALVEQRSPGDGFGYARTRITIYTNRYTEFDTKAAMVLDAALERAGHNRLPASPNQ